MKEFAQAEASVRQAVTQALTSDQQNFLRHLFHRQVQDCLPGSRILFLAAHPDDIIVGCGGTVLKYVNASRALQFLYFTDGRAAAVDPQNEEKMARKRAEEEERVAQQLNLPSPILIGCNEHEFTAPDRRVMLGEQLEKVLDEFAPDVVMVPYFFDIHPHHRYINVLLGDVMRRRATDFSIYCYEIWSLVPPGVVVDISEVAQEKMNLIRLYDSQLNLFDYLGYAKAIGSVHASLGGSKASACEAFCPYKRDEYLDTLAGLDLASTAGLSVGVVLTPPD